MRAGSRATPVADAALAEESTGVKQRILHAAAAEFARTGFHLTSLRTILDRSGSNKPMVYYHFRGKEGLYFAAVQAGLEDLAERLRETTARDGAALEKLRRFAEVYMESFLLSQPLLVATLRELESLPQRLYRAIIEEFGRLVAGQFRRLLAEGVERGEFRRIDIETCASGIIGILNSVLRSRGYPPQRAIATALSHLMDFYALGLLTPEALTARLREQEAARSEEETGEREHQKLS